MPLPNPDRALVEIEKLAEYALNPDHPTGRHKARVFKSALGLTQNDAEFLRAILQDIVVSHEATETGSTPYGNRYVIDFELTTDVGTATIRSAWIIRNGEDFARLTSCYVL